MLGQLASWQTVLSFRSSNRSATAPIRSRWGALTRNQSGFCKGRGRSGVGVIGL
jgi:hypothetical protein